MPLAATSRRGSALNCRLAVNGIQKASRSGRFRRSEISFMAAPLVLGPTKSGSRQARHMIEPGPAASVGALPGGRQPLHGVEPAGFGGLGLAPALADSAVPRLRP